MDETKHVIIDLGGSDTKLGLSDKPTPLFTMPSYIGRPARCPLMVGIGSKEKYVGDDAQAHRGIARLEYPIRRGIIRNFDDWEILIHHIFYNELRIAPEEHCVLLTEPPLNPKRNREKMVQMMFETFSNSAMYVAIPSILSLYAHGRTTGIALDVGDGVTHAVPVYEGNAITNAIMRLDLAGRDVTDYYARLMLDYGENFYSSSDMDIVKDIKQKTSHVADDFDEIERECSLSSELDMHYEMPDNRQLYIPGDIRFRSAECLFNPSFFLGREIPSIHEAAYNSIMKCDVDTHRDLFGNIILSGGTTSMNGFDQRFLKEIKALAPAGTDINIVAKHKRNHAAWIGGAILANMPTFSNLLITKENYDEIGAEIAHQRCY